MTEINVERFCHCTLLKLPIKPVSHTYDLDQVTLLTQEATWEIYGFGLNVIFKSARHIVNLKNLFLLMKHFYLLEKRKHGEPRRLTNVPQWLH